MLRFHIFKEVFTNPARNERIETDEYVTVGTGTTLGTTFGLLLLPIEPMTGALLLTMGMLTDELNGGVFKTEQKITRTRTYPERLNRIKTSLKDDFKRPVAPQRFARKRDPSPYSIKGGEKHTIWPAGKLPAERAISTTPNTAPEKGAKTLMITMDQPKRLGYDATPKKRLMGFLSKGQKK